MQAARLRQWGAGDQIRPDSYQKRDARVQESLARVQESLGGVQELDARVEESPGDVQKSDARARKSLARVRNLDARVQKSPTHVQELDARVRKSDGDVQESVVRIRRPPSRDALPPRGSEEGADSRGNGRTRHALLSSGASVRPVPAVPVRRRSLMALAGARPRGPQCTPRQRTYRKRPESSAKRWTIKPLPAVWLADRARAGPYCSGTRKGSCTCCADCFPR